MFAGTIYNSVWRADISTLPVELSYFNVSVKNFDVQLFWQTAEEQNNSCFDIERNSAHTGWEKLSSIKGMGSINTPTDYSYTDQKLFPGIYFYRLKQIDFNGNYKYFNLSGSVEIKYPGKFSLSQNYPNPFNPSTKISFDIPKLSAVKISVFDVMGREVDVLVNERMQPGTYQTDWNASKYPSGVYFYKLQSGDFSSVKRMVLVK